MPKKILMLLTLLLLQLLPQFPPPASPRRCLRVCLCLFVCLFCVVVVRRFSQARQTAATVVATPSTPPAPAHLVKRGDVMAKSTAVAAIHEPVSPRPISTSCHVAVASR